jgi:glycine/D-amino acid oxidase-like deaminating enzyme
MTAQHADTLIIGGGLYGAATAYYLARAGAKNVVVLERGDICSGGTAKSCAIVRTHYSIEANLRHAVESLKIFQEFDDQVGGQVGWRRTGYLIVGPESHKAPMEQVFHTQNAYGIDTAVLTPDEARRMHPLLSFHDVGVIGYDTMTGFADPYLTTTAYARRAQDLGVRFVTGTEVTGLTSQSDIYSVETTVDTWQAEKLLICAGPWTKDLARHLDLDLPMEISRHKVITLQIDQPYSIEWPIVKDLTTPDKIYFRPETGGVVLVGTGDHGDPIEDPDVLSDHVDGDHVARISALISNRMPAFAQARFSAGWTGPYDIPPDWNPLIGAVPGQPGLFIAAGFSGHGFKLAPTISEALAQTMLEQPIRVPIDMYALDRFAAGKDLSGAYGIGSIS